MKEKEESETVGLKLIIQANPGNRNVISDILKLSVENPNGEMVPFSAFCNIEEKMGLKLNIQKTKIMASGPITSWQIDGETMETVTNFNFLGSKITVDVDCSHKIKTLRLLWKNNKLITLRA